MNDNRHQEYLTLINELLNCSNEEEVFVALNSSQELLDTGLVQEMIQMAERLEEEGDSNVAYFLYDLVLSLAKILEIPGISENSAETMEEYLDFLMLILNATSDSGNDPRVVYPLLQRNVEKLNGILRAVLQEWGSKKLANTESNQASFIAADITNLGSLIQNFPLNKSLSNIEIAITCFQLALIVYTREKYPAEWAINQNNMGTAYCELLDENLAENLELAIIYFRNALEVRTREKFPVEWASILNNLGNAYCERIREDKAEDLELAITCYQNALEVRTREKFPVNWANTQNNLGSAYNERIKENPAENLELAITCYQNALKIHTREEFPVEWARTQANLGTAYHERIRGNKAENLELAIEYYRNSLEVRTRREFPKDWADTQNKLGNVYRERIKEDKAENLELAIACYQNALEIYTRREFPKDWADTQNNLGTVCSERIKRDKAENLELAIACYQNALEILNREDFPVNWARTQNNLGVVYGKRIKEDEAENLELAITCYQNALEILNREDFSFQWSTTQINLGTAYSKRINKGKAENIESAITCYEQALEILNREDFPVNWARTQNNLGKAYSERIEEDKTENIKIAITCYKKALEVRTLKSLPLDCLQTRRNLGNLYLSQRDWQRAIESYQIAIRIVEDTRLLSIYENRRQEIISENIGVFADIIHCYIQLKQYGKAIEYVERSKTRNLVELIASRNYYPKCDVSQELLDELDCLREKILIEKKKLSYITQIGNSDKVFNTKEDKQILQRLSPVLPDLTYFYQLQQQLDQLIEDDINDPTFSLTEKIESISYKEIQSLIDEDTAIVEWYITRDTFFVFLVTHSHPEPQVWQFTTEKLTSLENWVKRYLQNYNTNSNQLRTYLETNLQNLAEILCLDEILFHIPKKCDRLIVIPHRFLHILPLHALSTECQRFDVKSQSLTTQYLLDLFPRGIQYAPSCQLLKIAKSQQRPNFHNLFAIQNPTDDLIYTDLEVETIRSFFSNVEVLASQAANKAALKSHQDLTLANCIHFSCHGVFNSVSPLESALVLSNDEANTGDRKLTLAEIFELSLKQCRLVTLSACETGLTDINSLSDEYIGLPNGFIFAGSPSIVSSLWKVSDLSTAFLMIEFYKNLIQKKEPVAIALKKAQTWLRNITVDEFDFLLEQFKPQLDQIYSKLEIGEKIISQESIKQIRQCTPHPFSNPYYWAAFTVIGV